MATKIPVEVIPSSYSYVFSPYREPIARVSPGQQVVIHCMDSDLIATDRRVVGWQILARLRGHAAHCRLALGNITGQQKAGDEAQQAADDAEQGDDTATVHTRPLMRNDDHASNISLIAASPPAHDPPHVPSCGRIGCSGAVTKKRRREY